VDKFISEDDLQTLEGFLKYQAVDEATASPEDLKKWARHFEEARERAVACPNVGLMKLKPVPGEQWYAVAVQEGPDLWLTLWVKRSPKGEFFVMLPRGNWPGCWHDDQGWDLHTSYHLDGTLHIKSFGDKVIERKNQPLTGPFRGHEDLGSYAGHAPKGVGAICDPTAFSGVFKVAPGVLGPCHGVVKVDLVEPRHEPMECPEIQTVTRQYFCDVVPWVVIRVGSYV
jgi:hypothetical protein